MKGGTAEYKAVLRTQSEEGTERIIAKAERTADGAYSFEKEGVMFRVKATGDRVLIERRGEMAYELTLLSGQKTKVRIMTSFGEVDAQATVKRLQVQEADGRTDISCDYVLDFSGYAQYHEIHFSAKRMKCKGEEGDEN